MNDQTTFPPILTMQELPALRQACRLQRKTIVSTNGCFDLLHAGHVRMLSQARQLGDVLVVALNDDDSVRQLKGPNRPLVNQEDRAVMLSALKAVDHVVVFSGLLPNEMLDLLQPDIHCKAADYSADSLPEAEVVTRHGGRIHILPFQSGYATSELLNLASKATQSPLGGTGVDAAQRPERLQDLLSHVLSGLLGSANLCRQMSYRMAPLIVQSARAMDACIRGGGKVWVYAEGTLTADEVIAKAMPDQLRPSLEPLPLGPYAARVIKAQAGPADMILIITSEDSEVGTTDAVLMAAEETSLKAMVITSGAPPASPAAVNLSVHTPSHLQACQLRLGIVQALGQALGRLSRE